MSRESVLRQFDHLNVWVREGERAPHKPLLVLYALARWRGGDQSAIPFGEVDRELPPLLSTFGPPRQRQQPEFPFWHLKNDGVWTVHYPADLRMRKGKHQPPRSALRAFNVTGEFSDEVKDALRADPSLADEIATRLLEGHFPDSYHSDILNAVGFDLDRATQKKRKRDPKFREKVLVAYEYRCAVCGFDVRLGQSSVALDAAHIRWHQAGGPAIERNGLALCSLHHKTFDLGVFTVGRGGILLVSDWANGSRGFNEFFLCHHGSRLRPPQRPEWEPAPEFLEWHMTQVFKGAARHLQADPQAGASPPPWSART